MRKQWRVSQIVRLDHFSVRKGFSASFLSIGIWVHACANVCFCGFRVELGFDDCDDVVPIDSVCMGIELEGMADKGVEAVG